MSARRRNEVDALIAASALVHSLTVVTRTTRLAMSRPEGNPSDFWRIDSHFVGGTHKRLRLSGAFARET
jgi:hypothetical protein